MSDIYDRQKEQEEIQKSEDFLNIFSKVVSGKAGYKTVIEKKKPVIQCKNCNAILDSLQKFCHECGTKVEKMQ